MNLIVFRQYLESKKSFQDLEELKKRFCEMPEFKENIIVVVQVGKKGDSDDIIKYCERQESPQKGKINIYHLSSEKAGLTLPIVFALELAKRDGYEKLVISDSDFQFPIGEIFNCLNDFKKTEKAAYFPKRIRRELSIKGYKLNRYVIEDLENDFVHYNYDIKQRLDFQSGLVILNKVLINDVLFLPSGKWAGNVDLVKDVLDCGGEIIAGKACETTPQEETSISYENQLQKFKELEKKFHCSLKDVLIHFIKSYSDDREYNAEDFLMTTKEFLSWYF